MIRELRRGRDELAQRVGAFTDVDLARQSACAEWDVAQVLSHLGSGAEIGIGTLDAVLAGTDPPGREASEPIWARWNAMSRAEHQANWLTMTDRHLAGLEALSDEQLSTLRVTLSFLPEPLDAAGFLALRLNEQALHHWDVAVTFDAGAVIPEPATELLVDVTTGMMRWLGHANRWRGEATLVALTLTAPARDWTLVIDETVNIDQAPAAHADVRLIAPSETFIRLAAGRLRDADVSRVAIEGPLKLGDLAVLFPGF